MKLFIYFCVIFLTSSCGIISNFCPDEKSKIASELRSKVAKKLENELELIPFGFGGQMMDQIEMLGLVFQYRQSVDLAKARRILVNATKIFLQEIKHNEKIQPYLSNIPFNEKNISITILLQKPDGSKVNQGELTLIESSNGFLEYATHDPHTLLLSMFYKETYEEALEKLESLAPSD